MTETTTTSTAADRAQAVTDGLRTAGELGPDDRVTNVAQLSGGWSRHSFVATAQLASGEERRYIVRAEAPGGVLETDLAAEYELYHALDGDNGIATPSVYYFDATGDNPFGNRYIVMEMLTGKAANAYHKRDRAWLEEDWNGPRGIANDMVDNAALIHDFPVDRIPAGAVPVLDFLAVVDRWEKVYLDKHLIRDPVTEEAFAWLRSRVPADTDAYTGIVHGDFRVGNCLVDDGHITAVLDWELAYIGDVRFDLGYMALGRLAGKHLRPVTSYMNAFTEEDWFFEQYAQRTGRPVDRDVIRTFEGLAIMMLLSTHYQGIWMYANGRSKDFRLAWNRFGVIGLRQDLAHLMQW